MNASDLYQKTAPLFAKHPTAKPENISWSGYSWEDYGGEKMMVDNAYLIIQGHLVQMLAEKNYETPEIRRTLDGKNWIPCGLNIEGEYPTLLEALIAAAEAVPQ